MDLHLFMAGWVKEGMEEYTLEQVLESTLESVDKAEHIVLREAEALGFDEDDLHRVGIALRECMVNAVVHGNRYNSRKKVHLKVVRTPESLTVMVGDEGDGFDPAARARSFGGSENLLRGSGRGVMLMQVCSADEVPDFKTVAARHRSEDGKVQS